MHVFMHKTVHMYVQMYMYTYVYVYTYTYICPCILMHVQCKWKAPGESNA